MVSSAHWSLDHATCRTVGAEVWRHVILGSRLVIDPEGGTVYDSLFTLKHHHRVRRVPKHRWRWDSVPQGFPYSMEHAVAVLAEGRDSRPAIQDTPSVLRWLDRLLDERRDLQDDPAGLPSLLSILGHLATREFHSRMALHPDQGTLTPTLVATSGSAMDLLAVLDMLRSDGSNCVASDFFQRLEALQ